ncbi:MAG TPA: hydroxymethylbilane synthase, partial [Rhodospirillales bacterium]|nr:hydroxymethylbilane synthase [Rhodospirillales bacterium]
MANNKLRIGTRGSPLALTQANLVIDALKHVHPNL